MKAFLLDLFFFVAAGTASPASVRYEDSTHNLQKQVATILEARSTGHDKASSNACSAQTASIRKDWENLSVAERKEYIRATQCLLSKPSTVNPAEVPGARTRYDDFVADHINQTLSIHATGNFLSWHRYFVHGYESVLKEECQFNGTMPYWNWFSYQDDPRKSPVFDGSETSLGGDGEFVRHNGSIGGGGIFLPSGQGGGCIASGPFKNLQVNLGPVQTGMDGQANVPSKFAYNPRCLRRDLTPYASRTWLTLENLYNITLGDASHDIVTFQDELQGRFADGFFGLHGAGHFVMGGDGTDFFSSLNDPAFFLHHTMVDKVWWMWQILHPKKANTVGGTITLFNTPPSRNTTADDLLEYAAVGLKRVKIKDVLDTLGGEPLCYIYE